MNLVFLILQFILLIVQIFVYYKVNKKVKSDMHVIVFKLIADNNNKNSKSTKNTKSKKEGK